MSSEVTCSNWWAAKWTSAAAVSPSGEQVAFPEAVAAQQAGGQAAAGGGEAVAGGAALHAAP